MLVGVLAMQGGIEEHIAILERLGVTWRRVKRPEHLEEVEAIILPGGESTTMSKLLVTNGLMQPLQAAIDNGLPVFGTCAGLILLAREVVNTREDAQQFAAIDMVVRRNAFGRQNDSFEVALTFPGIDSPVDALFIRAPWVEEIGPDVEVLARVPSGEHKGMIVGVRQGHAMAISFHPESAGETRIHELFLDHARTCAVVAHADGSVTQA
ncbi:pyridoxal 5'-phosphate synthase glutaminase subunit PdxT [Corynebacterium sp. 13CS0277]|uniref:pyridoxal 5'-phosphate synthase glutaminase subunit PdxT n=1 Tax=Corynebacterium sp. 13CS0277 TaxID=2071994 RepID=UPI000D04809A|nr:pyridoxal 5'-phosphate synthase glutaminase subunit PdxT [Corynebacterium sp. 13CS0277]PRQ11982.1 pyridoxal 5'-phosphate synthase glutaminase subunit PdxT [Corynebacterium sp. 13CS0277]